jgi:hypothetical protein
MRRLLEHVISLSEESISQLSIQDAALCHAYRVNGGEDLESIAGIERLDGQIRRWLASAHPVNIGSEGRRTQTLVRELVDRVQSDSIDQMSRDELDLLETVYAFAQSVQHPEPFERLRRLIAPRRARIAARRASLPPVPGLPTLAKRFLIVRPEDILRAQQREVQVLAGVQLPSRGPVMVHSGHVRVLGDVPEGTTLVVEQAACVVDGCVLGRVAASGACEIQENVSGVVISRNGDVRARHLVENAFVVAKRGRVQCRKAHGARMVFAGDVLHVAEVAARSHLIAPTVLVDDGVQSGRVDASLRVVAGRLGGGEGALDMHLRRGLSCLDYGEKAAGTMTADISRALRARGALQCVRSQMSLALRSAEQAAETCLMFLLVADGAARAVEDICVAQRRLEILNRIVLGLRALYAEAEAQEHEGNGAVAEGQNPSVADRIEAELSAMIHDSPGNDPVREMYKDLTTVSGMLAQRRLKRIVLKTTLEEIVTKLDRSRSEAERLRETIRRGQEQLAHSGRVREILGGEPVAKSRVLTFQKVMERARAEHRESALRVRSESPFIVTMSRTIDKRIAEARKFKCETDALRRRFEEAQRVVWNLYQMRIDEDDGLDRAISVEGAFTGVVRMYFDPRILAADASDASPESAFIPSPSSSGRVRYICAGGRIREAALAAPEADRPEAKRTVA